ncbi:uncharacterized protein [Haliotis asinina]|uniref:uncharacterized protein n=1 Tax=Haliotis asinina TaxID=109174 RepID=UPI003531B35C
MFTSPGVCFRGNMSYCRHQNETSCLWKSNDGKDTYRIGLNYYIRVVVTTGSGADEAVLEVQNFTMNTSLLVKPAPVHSLTVLEKNWTCLSLQWKHNKSYRNLLYTLHVKQGADLQIYNYTNTTSATTCGLHPGLLYTLEVACIPIPYSYKEPHGFYSQWTSVHAKTWEDVPSGVPGVEISSFRYHRCSSQTSDCEVTIYWQPVPEMECNGEITHYQVTRIDTELGQMQEFEVEGSNTSLDLWVKKVRQYLIKLKARTRVGYSEHYASMVIPAYQYKLPPPTDILVEAVGSILHISWGPPELTQNFPAGRILGYTLYYCTDSKSTYKCEDPVQWLHLTNNQTSLQWTVPDGDHDNKMIGMSVEMETSRKNISSGLLWNECVYRQKGECRTPYLCPPRNVRFSRKQPDNGLQVDWDKFVCADNPVYVSHFVLSYCVTNSRAECADPSVQVNISNKDVSHVINSLSAGVKYRVTLRAVSRTEKGPESDPISKEVKKASGYMWLKVLVVVLVVVFILLVLCVCYWKVHNCRVPKKGWYFPITMPEFPLSQITVSNGQHEYHPYAVDNINNSTNRNICVFSETHLSCMDHQNQSSTSGSRAKSCMKQHRAKGSSSDASEILSSVGNKSVETYSKVDLPSECTTTDNISVCLSNQDCLNSGQNYSSEMEVQHGFMFASPSFSIHVPKPQLPTLPTLSPTPHAQSPTTQAQSPTPPTHSPTPSQSTTPYTQSPTPPTQSSTPSTQSLAPKTQLPTSHAHSPTPNNQPPTSNTQSPLPHTPSSTRNSQSPTPPTQSHTSNSIPSDLLSLAHLPTGPSTQPQIPNIVPRTHLLNPFAPPPHSQAPHVITHQLPNPSPPFTLSLQPQSPTAIATCLPPSCSPATPLPSCTPTQAPSAGYVSHVEALNLCQSKNHHE